MIRFPEQSGLQLFFPIVTMSKPCQTIYSYFLTYTEVFLFQHLGEEIAQAMNTGGLPHGGSAHFRKSSKPSLYLGDPISTVSPALQMKSVYDILICVPFPCPIPLPSVPYQPTNAL